MLRAVLILTHLAAAIAVPVLARRLCEAGRNDVLSDFMRFPIEVPGSSGDGLQIAAFTNAEARELFTALDHEQVWAHIPGDRPSTVDDLASRSAASDTRQVFVVSASGSVVGTTSYFHDPADPHGVEIGATLYTPSAWGTGVNTVIKDAMLGAAFAAGAQWVQFRTDERNRRSAAAILKLAGVVEQSPRREPDMIREDGTVRTSRMFRIPRPT